MSIDYHHEARMEQEYYPAKKVTQYFILLGNSRLPRLAQNILQRDPKDLIGRKILRYQPNHGDYDDGSGPGFLGLLLDEDPARNLKKEWLIVTVSSADHITLLDGKWVQASAEFNKIQTPLGRRPKYGEPSLFELIVSGALIKEVDLQTESFKVKIEDANKQEHLIEVLNKDPRLSWYPDPIIDKEGKVTYKPLVVMKPGDHIGNYIIFMEENGQIYV